MVTVRPRTNGWQYDILFTWPDGTPFRERKQAPVPSKSGALRWAQERQVALLTAGRAAYEAQAKPERAPKGETVADWYKRYYEWRETRPSGAESISDSKGRFKKWIEPELGALFMRKVTRDDLERFAEHLDEQVAADEIAPKTALNIWGEVTAGFAVATRGKNGTGKNLELRVLEANPAETAAGPDGGTRKQKPFLRPEEVSALLSCTAVPIERRQVYAVALYTAMRQAELRGLRAGDVDLTSMQIIVTRQRDNKGVDRARTKTGRARVVQIEPNLVPLLRVLVEGKPSDERILRVPVQGLCASLLREDLLKAKCSREALHVPMTDPMRIHIKFHNLRDTCLTHMAVRRDAPQDVQWRAGHTTSAMTEKYISNARYEAGANFGVPLGPLPAVCLGARAKLRLVGT